MARSIATFFSDTLASIAKRLKAKRRTYPDGYLPRQRRHRAVHGTRAVERVVIDQWLMWRH